MVEDRYGNPMHECSRETAAHLDRAVEALLHFDPAMERAVGDALLSGPASPLAQSFAAYLGVLGTEPGEAAAARQRFERYTAGVDAASLPARERIHLAAAGAWLAGDLKGAADLLEELSLTHPRDALALAVGHQLDFFTGDAVRLRDRIGGALSAWDTADPHRSLLLGMYAFGLEESGHYRQSEEAGLAAVEQNPRDVWAIHAVVHTYEMQGRVAEGIRYLDARRPSWAQDNYLDVHTWWHYALYALEADDTDTALAVYDASLHHGGSAGLAMELLDAAALLWRIRLAGAQPTARWEALADAWAARADPPYYAFNDVHAVMSYAGAGRFREAERLIADRRRWLSEHGPASGSEPGSEPGSGSGAVTNRGMTADIGLPACEALLAHARGDHPAVVALLWPLRRRFHEFGGSHAQRDALQRTLLDSALGCRRHDLARVLLSERAGLRPDSSYNWTARARLADALGDTAVAGTAREHARTAAAAAAAALRPGVTGPGA
ncbi:tetratricopeptide repeat protein [Streptomyces bambusae]|uniref:tetratricopeptide repeat protein n=1 Tax=Streptomyces bambusae TaxID=1550616 RepID=UPI001CFF0D5D|nr:tetratricopeptide repeat protein [Streptomyces bambusae]MCB5168461.1 tetratricopeptide repeat protein [Streptomyces bambusae]